jgi:hypothetical protein
MLLGHGPQPINETGGAIAVRSTGMDADHEKTVVYLTKEDRGRNKERIASAQEDGGCFARRVIV